MQALVRELGDGAFSGTLDSDSGNIVGLVRELYDVSNTQIIIIAIHIYSNVGDLIIPKSSLCKH